MDLVSHFRGAQTYTTDPRLTEAVAMTIWVLVDSGKRSGVEVVREEDESEARGSSVGVVREAL